MSVKFRNIDLLIIEWVEIMFLQEFEAGRRRTEGGGEEKEIWLLL